MSFKRSETCLRAGLTADLLHRRKPCKFSHNLQSEHNYGLLRECTLHELKEDELFALLLQNDPSLLPEVTAAPDAPDGGVDEEPAAPAGVKMFQDFSFFLFEIFRVNRWEKCRDLGKYEGEVSKTADGNRELRLQTPQHLSLCSDLLSFSLQARQRQEVFNEGRLRRHGRRLTKLPVNTSDRSEATDSCRDQRVR